MIGSCSKDPIGYLKSSKYWNLFSYVLNAPFRFVDPLGLDVVPPGVLPSDGLNPGDSFCCGGKRGIVGRQCCVPNATKGATDGPFMFDETERSTCKVCWRRALVPGGSIGSTMGLFHMWLKCDFGEVGLGELGGGVPGQTEDEEYESPAPYPDTGVNDHTGQADAAGSNCVDIVMPGCCMARQMVQRPTGKTCGPPPMYNCNTFVFDALNACGLSKQDKKRIEDEIAKGTFPEGHAVPPIQPNWFPIW